MQFCLIFLLYYIALFFFGQLGCCGVNSYRDWNKNQYYNCSSEGRYNPSPLACSVPHSCCKVQDTLMVSTLRTENNFYQICVQVWWKLKRFFLICISRELSILTFRLEFQTYYVEMEFLKWYEFQETKFDRFENSIKMH